MGRKDGKRVSPPKTPSATTPVLVYGTIAQEAAEMVMEDVRRGNVPVEVPKWLYMTFLALLGTVGYISMQYGSQQKCTR